MHIFRRLKVKLTISQFTLKEMIRQTIFSIAVNENNKLMTGELFEIKNNCLRVVSLDGHRIAIRKMALKENIQTVRWLFREKLK